MESEGAFGPALLGSARLGPALLGSARPGPARPAPRRVARRASPQRRLTAAGLTAPADARQLARELWSLGAMLGRQLLGGVRRVVDLSYSERFMDFTGSNIPSSMKKLVVTKLSPNFREAVSLQTAAVPTPGDSELLVRNR